MKYDSQFMYVKKIGQQFTSYKSGWLESSKIRWLLFDFVLCRDTRTKIIQNWMIIAYHEIIIHFWNQNIPPWWWSISLYFWYIWKTIMWEVLPLIHWYTCKKPLWPCMSNCSCSNNIRNYFYKKGHLMQKLCRIN